MATERVIVYEAGCEEEERGGRGAEEEDDDSESTTSINADPHLFVGECYNEDTCKRMAANMESWEEDFYKARCTMKNSSSTTLADRNIYSPLTAAAATTTTTTTTTNCSTNMYNECFTIVNNLKQYGRKLIIPSSCNLKINTNFQRHFKHTGHAYAIDATSSYVIPLVLDFDCKKCSRRKHFGCSIDSISREAWCPQMSDVEIERVRMAVISTIENSIRFEALGHILANGPENSVVVYKKRDGIDCNLHIYFSYISLSILLYDLLIEYLTLHLDAEITNKYVIDKISAIPLPYSAKHENAPYRPVARNRESNDEDDDSDQLCLSASFACYLDVSGLRLVEKVLHHKEIQVCEFTRSQQTLSGEGGRQGRKRRASSPRGVRGRRRRRRRPPPPPPPRRAGNYILQNDDDISDGGCATDDVDCSELEYDDDDDDDDDEDSDDDEDDDETTNSFVDTWFALDKNIGNFVVHDLQWKAVLQTSIPDYVLYCLLTNRRLKDGRQQQPSSSSSSSSSIRYPNFVAYINNYGAANSCPASTEMFRLMDTRVRSLDVDQKTLNDTICLPTRSRVSNDDDDDDNDDDDDDDDEDDEDERQRRKTILKNLRILTQRIAQVAFRKERKYTLSLNDAQLFSYLVRFVFGPKNCCGYSFYALHAICLFAQNRASTPRAMDRREEALRIKRATLDILYHLFTAGINFIHSAQAKIVLHILETLQTYDCMDQLGESLAVPEHIFGYITTLIRLDVLSTESLGNLFQRVQCYMQVKASRIDTEFPAAKNLTSKKDFMNYCIVRAEEVNQALQSLFEEWLRITFHAFRSNTRQESVCIFVAGTYVEVDEKISEGSKYSVLCTLENQFLRPVYTKISKNFNFNQKEAYTSAAKLATGQANNNNNNNNESGRSKGQGGAGRVHIDVFCKLESVRTLFQRAWSSFIEKKCIIQSDCCGYYPFFIKTSCGIFNTLTGQYMLPIPYLYFANQKNYCTVASNGYTFEKLPISSEQVSVDCGKLLKYNCLLCTTNYPTLTSLTSIYLKSQSIFFYLSILVPGILAIPTASIAGRPLSLDGDQLLTLFEQAIASDVDLDSSEQALFYLTPAILRYNYPFYLVVCLVELLNEQVSFNYKLFSTTALRNYLLRYDSGPQAEVEKFANKVESIILTSSNSSGNQQPAGSAFSYISFFKQNEPDWPKFESVYEDYNLAGLLEKFPPTHSRTTIALAYLTLFLDKYTRVLSLSQSFGKIVKAVEKRLAVCQTSSLDVRNIHQAVPYSRLDHNWLVQYHTQLGRSFGSRNRKVMTFLFYDNNNRASEDKCCEAMYQLNEAEGLNLKNMHRALNVIFRLSGKQKEFSTLPTGYLEMFSTLSLMFSFYGTAISDFLSFLSEIYQPGAQRKHVIIIFGQRYTGKSYILKLLECMHGQSTFAMTNRLGNYSTNGGPNTETIEMNRCYLGTVQEVFAINASLLRVLTGSDAQHYRSMYKDLYMKYRCTASFVCSTNKVVRIVNFSSSEASQIDADEAIRERIVIFDCKNIFIDTRSSLAYRSLERNPLFVYSRRMIPSRNNPTEILAMAFSNIIYSAYLLNRGKDGNVKPTLTNLMSLQAVDKMMMVNNYVYRMLNQLKIVRDPSKCITCRDLKKGVVEALEAWREEKGADKMCYTWTQFLEDFETIFSDCVPFLPDEKQHQIGKDDWTYHGVGYIFNTTTTTNINHA